MIRKATAAPQIEGWEVVANANPRATNLAIGDARDEVCLLASWSDGAPVAAGERQPGHWGFVQGGNHYARGVRFSVQADERRERTLNLYLRRWNNKAKVTFSLSDHSAPDVVWRAGDAWYRCEKLSVNFRAGAPDARLNVAVEVGE